MSQHFRRYLIINSAAIVVSFVVCGLLSFFIAKALAAKKDQIIADRQAISRRSFETENLTQLKNSAVEAAALQDELDALLPTQDGIISFPQFMNTVARTHSVGMTFNFSSPPAAPGAGVPGSVAFLAIAEGSSENLARFIDDLENHATKYTMSLERILVIPQGSLYRADIEGKVFFKPNLKP